METCFQSLSGNPPFRYQNSLRISSVQKCANLFPELNGVDPSLIFFDKAACHINAKSVTPEIQPEGHDVLYLEPHAFSLRRIPGKLPGLRNLAEAVVQGGLRRETVECRHPGAFRDSAQEAGNPLIVLPPRAAHAPDIPVC